MSKLEAVLNELYSQERNIQIFSFWDAGWAFHLGDPVNGYGEGRAYFRTLDELANEIERVASLEAEPTPEPLKQQEP